jgi:glucokinase
VNTLVPDIVVLGGGLVEAMPDIFLAQVKNGIKNYTMPSFENLVSVVAARLGDDAAAIGAATWAKTVIRGA